MVGIDEKVICAFGTGLKTVFFSAFSEKNILFTLLRPPDFFTSKFVSKFGNLV
jgi:hypothetical protein